MAPRFATGIVFISFMFLFAAPGHAQIMDMGNQPAAEGQGTGEVTIERQPDISQSYKNRRGKHGVLFGVAMEQFYPVDYRSVLQDAYIEDMIGGDKIDLIGVELGYKYNFSLGSVGFLVNYAQGSIDGAVNNVPRTLNISRTGLSVNYAADVFFDEPWVVPYIQAGVHQFNVDESDDTQSASATASMAFNYRFGLLFQLDWIENSFDKSAKQERLTGSGLENTFLEIYYAEHLASSNAIDPSDPSNDGEPNMYSSGELGLGLKLEF